MIATTTGWWCAWCVSGPILDEPRSEYMQILDGVPARIALGLEPRSVWFCGPACVKEWDRARKEGVTVLPDTYLSLRGTPVSITTTHGAWTQWERRGLIRYIPGSTQGPAHILVSRAVPAACHDAVRRVA